MVEELAYGDLVGGCRVGQREIRQVTSDWRVQLHLAGIDQLHNKSGRKHFRVGADLKNRTGRRFDTGGQIEHACGEVEQLVAPAHGERGTRDLMPSGQRVEGVLDTTELAGEGSHGC